MAARVNFDGDVKAADEPADLSCCSFDTRSFECHFNHDAFRVKPGTKKAEKNCKGEADLDQKKPETKAGAPGSTNDDNSSVLAEDKRFSECWHECHYESGRCDFCDIPIFDKDAEADHHEQEKEKTSFLEHHYSAFLEVRHRVSKAVFKSLFKSAADKVKSGLGSVGNMVKKVTGLGEVRSTPEQEAELRDKDWEKRLNKSGKKFGGKYLKGYCCKHGYFDKWDPAKHGGAEWKYLRCGKENFTGHYRVDSRGR